MGYVVSANSADPYQGIVLVVEESPEDAGSNQRIRATRYGGGTNGRYEFILKGHFASFLLDVQEINDDVLEDAPPSSGQTISKLYTDSLNASRRATGTAQPVWHKGAAAPDNTLGGDGDWYFRESNRQIYKKTGGTWSVDNTSDADYAEPAFFAKNTDLSGTSATAWQQDTDSVCASYAIQETYPGPAAPRLTRTSQGNQQVTVYFAENERPLADLAPIAHAQWRTVTLPAGAVSRSSTVIASFNAQGVLRSSFGPLFGLMSNLGNSNVDPPVERGLYRYTVSDEGNVTRIGEVTWQNSPTDNTNFEDISNRYSRAFSVRGGEYIVAPYRITTGRRAALWERVDDTTYSYVGDLISTNNRDFEYGTWLGSTLYVAGATQLLSSVNLATGEATQVSGIRGFGSGVSSGGWARGIFEYGGDIYYVALSTVGSSSTVHRYSLYRANLTGSAHTRIGLVSGINFTEVASNTIVEYFHFLALGSDIYVSVVHTPQTLFSPSPTAVKLYKATVSGSGLALQYLADVPTPVGRTTYNGLGFTLGSKAFTGVLDRTPELAVNDADSTDLQTLNIRYNDASEIRLSATFDSGFSMFGKTLHINGISTGSSGNGPWTIGTSHALWNELNTLMAGGTIGIEIYDTSSPVQYGAWQDLTCCVESDHVTIENLTNDQLIQVEVWNLDGSGKESSRVRENTFAQADPAPDPIPLVGTNTSGGALLQWHE